ncbi:MAG TPA: DNA topoisomerase [Phycisphaerales bacterium]|nr:DNA topoisomerase [Phycisphaerales bacterium]
MAKSASSTRSRKPASTKKKAGPAPQDDGAVPPSSPSDSAAPAKPRKFRGDPSGKKLVIVESPAKAKTINKYLGSGYVVKASVGHIRDLPSKNPKGDKSPVPGVDLENNFKPTYEVLQGKSKTVSELKSAAKNASEIWFATDLDREGEAIAWHLAHLLGINPSEAKRVIFNAITKTEIERAFHNPHPIDESRVDAQQARRIVDRIVGYQVSPLLWKKVARGLSAGRVQSVAVRLVVEREREIRAFIPDESWRMTARFTLDEKAREKLAKEWGAFIAAKDEKGNSPTLKSQNQWLSGRGGIKAELVEVAGQPVDISQPGKVEGKTGAVAAEPKDLTARVEELCTKAGLVNLGHDTIIDEKGKGPARYLRTVHGDVKPGVTYTINSIETKRTKTRPGGPFITSTLQQAASSRLGFGAQRTMRTAQRLYEGVEVPGEGAVGLITYMRTDSTHLSGDALDMARNYIKQTFGDKYLPEKPNFFGSSNKAAQEAHEAIRPTSLAYSPDRVKNALKPDEFKLYSLIWERFISCQMVAAEWDSTAITIVGGVDPRTPLTFRATGRVLAFDGFYRVTGVPTASDEQTLPKVEENRRVFPFSIDPEQKFSSPPARYSEASLIKTLESEGIGRPSTYASIISVIQDRQYVELNDRKFFATDLGEVVTDKLIEAFPEIMELGYTRDLEAELDHIEDEHKDWTTVLRQFYGPFKKQLDHAHTALTHAKAEQVPAPDHIKCAKCGAPTVYRFGKGGRFLSCSRYPKCDYAAPIDREGNPKQIETTNIACPLCGRPMIKRDGRFGAFLGCSGYGAKENPCSGILKLDKKLGTPLPPAVPPLTTDIACTKCGSPLYLRNGARGPWLSCSAFPKCRGRGKWAELPEAARDKWLKTLEAHEKAHPLLIIKDLNGNPLTDAKGKPLVRPDAADSNGGGGMPAAEMAADEAEYGEVA